MTKQVEAQLNKKVFFKYCLNLGLERPQKNERRRPTEREALLNLTFFPPFPEIGRHIEKALRRGGLAAFIELT